MLNRRSFFTTTACLGATLALGAEKTESKPAPAHKKRINLGIAQENEETGTQRGGGFRYSKVITNW
jgi:hypothetical protein